MKNKLKAFNRNKFTNIKEKNIKYISFMLIVVPVVKVNVTQE